MTSIWGREMRIITKEYLETHLFQILQAVEQFEETVIIADGDRHIARFTPIRQRISIEEAFADVYGKLILPEDFNVPLQSEP